VAAKGRHINFRDDLRPNSALFQKTERFAGRAEVAMKTSSVSMAHMPARPTPVSARAPAVNPTSDNKPAIGAPHAEGGGSGNFMNTFAGSRPRGICTKAAIWRALLVALIAVLPTLHATTVTPASIEVGDGPVVSQILVEETGAWSVTNNVAWLSVSASGGTGNENLQITVDPNTTGADRTDTVDIGGTTFTVTQRAAGSGLHQLWSMGLEAEGRLGGNRILHRTMPEVVMGDVQAVAAAGDHCLILKTDGTLWAAGNNSFGQLGDGTLIDRSDPVQVAADVVTMAAGATSSFFVKSDGTLWAMGRNEYGQLGDGTFTDRLNPTQVASDVSFVAAGDFHSLFVKSNGSLWGMGRNNFGQLGSGNVVAGQTNTPVALFLDLPVVGIAAGWGHSLFATSSGQLMGMGLNASGQLGDVGSSSQSNIVPVASNVKNVVAGYAHSLFIKSDDTLWAMGMNFYGALGDGSTTDRSTPVQVATQVLSVAAGSYHSFFVKTDGSLWTMGYNISGQLGDGTATARSAPVQVASSVSNVAAGVRHSLFVKTDGTLSTTGRRDRGQTADGTQLFRASPIHVASDVTDVVAGGAHTLFVKTDKSLWTTGNNSLAQLGDGFWTDRSTPIEVASDVELVAAGDLFSLFVKSDGTLWGMGSNLFYKIGSESFAGFASPKMIDSNVVSAAAGTDHTLFVKTDGTLWARGRNQAGQLGDGTTTNRSVNVQVASGVTSAFAAHWQSFFIRTDGTLWAMGDNSSGELGDGTTNQRILPVQVAADVWIVAPGESHTLFVKTNGTLWAMGLNDRGQLGDGTRITKLSPVQVATGVTGVAAAAGRSFYTKEDGTLWTMGASDYGEMGGEADFDRLSPAHIANGANAVSAGSAHVLFVASGSIVPAPVILSQPSSQAASIGETVTFTVVVSGDTPRQYQWRKDDVAIEGATTDTLEIANVQPSDEGTYSVVISDDAGTVTSGPATLVVHLPPTIATQPVVNTAVIGGTVIYSVTVTGVGPFTYQWRHNGTNISGATDATLTLSNVGASQGGSYTVVVSNAYGSVTSNAAALTIDTTPRLINISCRAFAGAGGNTLIAGFYLAGTGTKTVLVRGVGPKLLSQNVPVAVADPKVFVYKADQVVGNNDNWTADLASDFSQVGAFALDPGSKDAALKITLEAPGSYTVHLVNDGPVAEALIEVYDLSRDLGSRLSNVSCRLNINAGQTVILGTYLIGDPVHVLARNSGPSLAKHLQNPLEAMADPHLRVYADQTEIAVNDNWDVPTGAWFGAAGAFDFDAGSKDAALRVPFAPGSYTIHATGIGGSGVALIELYESP
jgi:alpha-tubulin suppressor-like RCC1 family protein